MWPFARKTREEIEEAEIERGRESARNFVKASTDEEIRREMEDIECGKLDHGDPFDHGWEDTICSAYKALEAGEDPRAVGVVIHVNTRI